MQAIGIGDCEVHVVDNMGHRAIDSSQSKWNCHNLAATQFPENCGAIIIIEFKPFKIKLCNVL